MSPALFASGSYSRDWRVVEVYDTVGITSWVLEPWRDADNPHINGRRVGKQVLYYDQSSRLPIPIILWPIRIALHTILEDPLRIPLVIVSCERTIAPEHLQMCAA